MPGPNNFCPAFMKYLAKAWIALVLLLWPSVRGAAQVAEEFETDPAADGRFVAVTFGTESLFLHSVTNGSLTAVLDVDYDPAFYLSSPFAPLTAGADVSFSFQFRITAMDTRVPPAAFCGLLTTNHVALGGDGLTMALSSLSNGLPAFSANVDQGPANFGGESVPLELNTDYLAVGRYTASNRQFSVTLHGGAGFVTQVGRSTALVTNTLGFNLDRVGLQNAGGTAFDYTNGSITVVLDNLSVPARPPVLISISTNVIVTEGDSGATNAVFAVSLSSPSVQTVRVDYATEALTAAAGADFLPQSGTLLFEPGTTSANITVPVLGNVVAQPERSFRVVLTNANGGAIVAGTGVGTILDDDVCLVSISDAAATEPAAGSVDAVFTVNLSLSNTQPVSVSFATANGTATAGLDYVATNGVLTFAPGETSLALAVSVLPDAIDEWDEEFLMHLAQPVNAMLSRSTGTGTITNTSPLPTVSFASATNVVEGNSGSTMVEALLTLSPASGKLVTVGFTTTGGTATPGADFEAAGGLVTFQPGQTSLLVPLVVMADLMHEGQETFFMDLTYATNAAVGNARELIAILDDDPVPSIDITDVSVLEGNTSATNALFRFTLSNPSAEPISVTFATTNGTAAEGGDYTATNGVLTWEPGATNAQVILVSIGGDTVNEADETFAVALSGPVNATLAKSQALGVILNDDFVTVSISDAQVVEGDSGSTNLEFLVSLSGPSAQQVTVRYATADGGAIAGGDYVAGGGVLTFTTNLSATISVAVLGDLTDEPDESLSVVLTELVNASFTRSVGLGVIHDDDPPSVAVSGVTMNEGDSNATVFVFTLTLSLPAAETVSVGFRTEDGTALAGSDYLATNGLLEFPPGVTTTNIAVLVHGDRLFEADESFFVVLENATNALIGNGLAFGTIVNDDEPPVVEVGDIVLIEGDCGNLTITLSATSSLPVLIRYCVTNLPARVFLVCDPTNCPAGPATNVPPACRSGCCDVVIPPGTLTAQLRLCAERDGLNTPDLHGRGGFEILAGSGQSGTNRTNQITIIDSDLPNLLVADGVVLEGDTGTNHLCFTIRLSSPRDTNATADFLTFDQTATAGLDYLAVTGSVVFPPGVTTQFVCVPVLGDLWYEGEESFLLVLTNFVNMSPSNTTARGVIIDDDMPPALAVADAAVIEGDTGTNYALFQVSVLSPTAVGIDVLYILFDGTASSVSDYVRDVNWLHFEPGVTNLTVVVPVLGDTRDEPDESFVLQIRNPVNATIARNEGVGTILDDDPPEIRVANADVIEGGDGATNVLSFAIFLSSTSAIPVTVEFFTGDGTASVGVDYVATNGVLTFPPGETNGVVIVAVIGETLTELNETLFLTLTNATGGTLAMPTGVGTILDDDAPCLTIAPATVREAAEGTTNLDFILTLDHPSTLNLAVNYTVANGTATAGADYIAQSGTILFPPGVSTQTLAIVVNADLEIEPAETLSVLLAGPLNTLLCEASGVGTILDGTVPPTLTVSEATLNEGNAGIASAVFPVTLSRASLQTVSFDLATADGTAQAGLDYLAQTGTVTFLPGTTTNFFTVPVLGDCTYELAESFFVHLTNAVSATCATNVVTGTILNDDPLPTVFIEGATVREGDNGVTNAVFRLSLSCPSSQPIELPFATGDGTALAGSDYIATNGVVSIPAGASEAFVTVQVLGDLISEPDEAFYLVLTPPSGAVLSTNQAAGLILDDDGVVLDISPAQGFEGGTAVFALTLSKPAGSDVTVNFATSDGTATAPPDYVSTNVVVRFPAGSTNQTQAVVLLSDDFEEPDEFFLVLLSQPVRASLATNQTQGLIIDATPPCLTLIDTSITDDGSGDQSVHFPVTLSSPSALPICVRFHTVNGTAIAGPDYIAVEGVLCFGPGETNSEVLVRLLPNTRDETNEFFYLALSDPTNATLCRGLAAATIINPLVSNAPPVIALAAPPACLTLPGDLTLTATASDPDGRINRVEFFAGTNSLGVRLEPPYGVTWRDVPAGQHVLTAVALDNVGTSATSAPVSFSASYPSSISIDDSTVFESQTGTNATFTLTLSSASCRTVSVEVITFDGTALAGLDYTAVWTNLVFLPGETVKLLPVPVLGDTILEPDENFLVCLTNQQNVTLARACGVGTILNDDTNTFPDIALTSPGDCLLLPTNLTIVATAVDPDGLVERVEFYNHGSMLGSRVAPPFEFAWMNVPSGQHLLTAVAVDNLGARATSAPVAFSASFPAVLTIDDVTVFESSLGTNAVFTLALASPSCRTVSVDVATANGTALAGSDYLAVQTNFAFLPGETVKLLAVPILGDFVLEPDETFFVCLTNQQYATLVRGCGVGTILNDDTNVFPVIALASPGDCLLLPTNLTLRTTVDDVDGLVDLVEFYDHAARIGFCAAPPFELVVTNVSPGPHLLTAVAVDNLGARATSAPVAFSASFPASLTIDDQTVFESLTGTNAIFTISLATPSCRTVSVNVLTHDGTALAGSDYLAVPTNIVFLPGETTKTVAVWVLGDNVVEPDETFFVCLTNQQDATLARACGVGTILNDDTNAPPTNLPPTVVITTPTNGAVFTTPPGLVPIEATALDSDGVVVRVEFHSGPLLLGADTNAPFSLLWMNNVAGGYALTAVATDDDGAKGTSAPVNITIRACADSITATPLQDLTRCVCDEVIFSTTVTSPDPVTYRWFLNGAQLPGETAPTLHLQGLKPEQAGVYTVEISSPCTNATRSATLTIRGAGNQNPVSFTNAARLILSDNTIAQPYPSALEVFCVPGPLKHISVTLDGLSHNFPDDVDILLVSPDGKSIKLISDCGGTSANKLTNVVLTFTDTAPQPLPDATRISSGIYAPTDYPPADTFPAPAPAATPSTSFAPFIGINPNGIWSLCARDDQGGDAGQILRGWFISVEWLDTIPFLTAPRVRPDGSFELTMLGLPHMTHVIEATSDLRNWTPISTNTPQSNTTLFIDPNAASSPTRFYRAVRCP